jgi:hypothetical protein
LATATATAQYEGAAMGASEMVDPFLGTQVILFTEFFYEGAAIEVLEIVDPFLGTQVKEGYRETDI